MLSLRQIVILIALIQSLQYGIKEYNLHYLSPLRIVFLLFNIVTEILIRVFMAYKFTNLFIFWMLVTDKKIQNLFNKLIKYTIKKDNL
jgi:hypothetical protein